MKMISVILALFVSSSFANFYCLQQSTNEVNQGGLDSSCNQFYNGSYSLSSTGGTLSSGFYSHVELYSTYTKPSSANNESVWSVAMGFGESSYDYINVTIPDSCWNYDSSNLLLRIVVDSNVTTNTGFILRTGSTFAQCFNGSDWNTLLSDTGSQFYSRGTVFGSFVNPNNWKDGNLATGTAARPSPSGPYQADYNEGSFGDSFVYEEAMYWNSSDILLLDKPYCSM